MCASTRPSQVRPPSAPRSVDNFVGWQKVMIPFSAFQGQGGSSPESDEDQEHQRQRAGRHPQPCVARPGAAGGHYTALDTDGPAGDLQLTHRGVRPPRLRRHGGTGPFVVDPTSETNEVFNRWVKSATAELWAGTTLTADGTLGFASRIPFTASATRMTVRVYSPDAGIQVRLKVEDCGDPTKSVETKATVTTAAPGWQTLTFNFANQAPGTAALNLAYTYNKVLDLLQLRRDRRPRRGRRPTTSTT